MISNFKDKYTFEFCIFKINSEESTTLVKIIDFNKDDGSFKNDSA